MNEPAPCPFCGGEALLREKYVQGCANRKNYVYECHHCKATFANWYRSIKKAGEAWNQRAANVAPVVHAHWIKSPNMDGFVVCSHCKSDNLHAQMLAPVPSWYKCCPNCGAIMDEEET